MKSRRLFCGALPLFLLSTIVFAQQRRPAGQRSAGAPSRAAGQRTTPARVALTSDSQITLDGGGFKNESFPLRAAQGDWFVLPNDAHASIDLKSGSGAVPVTLEVQWNGKQSEQVINGENNTDLA